MQSVSIIGIGRMGGALALALSRAGYRVANLVYRSGDVGEEIAGRISPLPRLISFADKDQKIESDIIFITSADPDIEPISSQIVSRCKRNSFVFHTSGSLSSEILLVLADEGYRTGSIHPLISVNDPIRGSELFAGAFFCVEGQDEAVLTAKQIVEALGGSSFSIDTHSKSLYHASAVTASGHLVALIDVAVEMLTKCGIESGEAKRILMPLIRSTVGNLEVNSNAKALTGTFARADNKTFERHLRALDESVSSDVRRIYLSLADRSLDLAEGAGQNAEDVRMIRDGIALAQQRSK